MGMTSGGREVDVGGGGAQLPKQLVLNGKKLAFKFSTYIFEYWPLLPASTSCPHT